MCRKMIRTMLLCLAAFSAAAYGEVYKWVDENGHTHYGEKPLSSNATEIKIQETAESPQTSEKSIEETNAERDRLLKVYEDERSQRKVEQQEQTQLQARKKQACMELENKLRDLKQGGIRYYKVDDKGERHYIDEQQMQERIKVFEKQYAKDC